MDKITKSVHILDMFMKTWCIKEDTNELEFECSNCQFNTPNGLCYIKIFANENTHDYDMDKFGSMAR